ncbi:MFS multidrug transporter [Leptodontidium sp. MPI-SDFR-AT-0119]|nr:MFS multidrug transporter [Leptodontidium sp. MPI-SDFR-AT-0119]
MDPEELQVTSLGQLKEEEKPSNPAGHANEATILGTDSAVNTKYLTGYSLVLMMASITVISFLMLLDATIIATAIPRITSEFHSVLDIGWYGASYQLTNASLQPMAGKFYTYFSSKRTFIVFFAVFEVGSLICGLASSSKMLIVGRAVAGLGASGIQNGIFAIIAGSVPMAKRPALTGIGMGFSQLGLVLGPLIGGILTQYVTWRWCFYINLPLGAITAALLIAVRIPDQYTKPKVQSFASLLLEKLDLTGFVLFAASAIQFLLALQYGGNVHPWNSSTVIGLFCGAAGALIAFLLVENHKGPDAMIPLWMIRKRAVWCSCLVMLFSVSTTFCATYFLPIYFQTVKGVSPTMSGVDLLPNIVSQLLFAVVTGILVGKMGYYLPWGILAGILLSVGCGLISLYSLTTPMSQWIGYQIILGAGRGTGMQIPIIAIQNTLEPSEIAIATSLLMFGHTIGGAVFLTLGQTIFTSSLRVKIPEYAPSVEPNMVIAAGATAIRVVITDKIQLAGVLLAVSRSLNRVFYLTTGAAVGSFCFAWGMGWKDIRKKGGVLALNTDEEINV